MRCPKCHYEPMPMDGVFYSPCPECGYRESWRRVVGYERAYEVSDWGRVRSLARTVLRHGRDLLVPARYLKPGVGPCGYPLVSLWKGGRGTTKLVHHLVLSAFVGSKPVGQETRHLDGDRANAALLNLRYGTHKDNEDDRRRHGTMCEGERHGHAKLTARAVREIRSGVARGVAQKTYAARFGVSQPTISDVVRGVTWRHI